MSLLAFHDVACVRGDRLLFGGVSFALRPGDALLVEGPNGIGKSSLIRLAAGLLPVFAGQVTRGGAMALADERAALDAELALGEALLFWARLAGGGGSPTPLRPGPPSASQVSLPLPQAGGDDRLWPQAGGDDRLWPQAGGDDRFWPQAGRDGNALLPSRLREGPGVGNASLAAPVDSPAARTAAAMATLGLSPLAHIPVRLLSTGQRRRAALARVLASGAPIWLLDEPGNGLDADSLAALGAAMAAHRAGGGAILAAAHMPLPLPGAARLALAEYQR